MSDDIATPSQDEVLIFKTGEQRLALPATDIIEIIRPPTLTRVPHSHADLLGVANFRGAVLPVVSTTRLLGVTTAVAKTPATRVLVVKRATVIGLLVDEVLALAKSSDAKRIDLDALLDKNFSSLKRADAKRDVHSAVADAPLPQTRDELVFLAFELAGQEYALPLDEIESIAALPTSVAGLPRTDQAMIGVAEIDGTLIPLVSLRVLLGFPATVLHPSSARVVLTKLAGAFVGLVVDGMKEILRVSHEFLDPVPSVLTRGKGEAQIEAICRLDEGSRLIAILAPARLFDQETITRLLAHAQHGSTQMAVDQTENDQTEQFVVFELGSESYGLPIASVDEIVRSPDNLTRVPKAPAFIKGLMNLRGKAVPVIDQTERFSSGTGEDSARRRVIIVTIDGLQAGFLVDKVSEVLSIPARELRPAPDLGTDAAPVIDRVAMIERAGSMILLVDPKALLDRAERDVLEAISNASGASPPS